MVVRFYQGWFQVLVIDLPLFIASTCSISSFYLTSERVLYPKTWKRSILYMPFVMAIGIGLSVRNAAGVMEAIFGVKSEFVRTPKYNVEGQGQRPGQLVEEEIQEKRRAGCRSRKWFSDCILLAAVGYAIQNENYATVPFLLLFVWGYLYTGLMSLAQIYLERLRFGVVDAGEVPSGSHRAPGF